MLRPLLVLAPLALGCSGSDTTTPPLDSDPPPCTVEVPDPGSDPTEQTWISDDTNVSPELAWPVGVVERRNQAPLYIQTILPTDEDSAYFVFSAGKDFNLPIRVQNSQNPFESMHLFEAGGLCLGAEVDPITEDSGANFLEATWAVEEGQVYVLEIHVPGGGFF